MAFFLFALLLKKNILLSTAHTKNIYANELYMLLRS